jgi:hypothetical protein
MSTARQELLFLYSENSDLASPVRAWSRYSGAGTHHRSGDLDEAPYASVVAAMQDGWRVLQVSQLLAPTPGADMTATSFLKYEALLERWEEIE